MGQSEMQSVFRIFWSFILAIFLLFGGAMLSSFLGSFGGGLPDEAYGLEELSAENFTLPEEPILTVWVWEKNELEQRELVMLQPRMPVNTGPAVAWGGGYATRGISGTSFSAIGMPGGQDGLNVSVQGEGAITAKWEHERGYDCGHTHTWWYSVDPDLTGGVDNTRLSRNHTAEAQGTNSLCILWKGMGIPLDTVTVSGDPVYDVSHKRITLADVIGMDEERLNETVYQEQMTILLRLECRNLLGRLTATATVRLTMVSEWIGAGELYMQERPAIIEAEEQGRVYPSRWIDYAFTPPTWTAELIGYTQAE